MPNLWTLGGLSVSDLLRQTARASWRDAVFGQGGRMAFYHLLAIFPSLLVFLTVSARFPHLGAHMKTALQALSSQVLPEQVSQLFGKMMDELNGRALSSVQLVSVCAGAFWAALNAAWAMVWGLNRAYEVEEHRSSWELTATIVGLTLALALIAAVAVLLIFFGSEVQAHFGLAAVALHSFEWVVLAASFSLSFGLLYRFGPNLRNHEWSWSTPGALCALVLWLGSTFAARVYFDRVNDYSRSYGHLNTVVMLLLWLYVTNGSMLIGGEMNSAIEKAAVAGSEPPQAREDRRDRSGS